MNDTTPAIKIQNLTKVYGNTIKAVDDILSEGPETKISAVSGAQDVEVTINDDEDYCGKNSGQIYLLSDVNKDCYVNLLDVQEMAIQWLGCTNPFYPDDCDLVLP